MTITTRNEVLVTCQDAPLMELLRHLEKDHSLDLDYCLDNLGINRMVPNEPPVVRTQQEFLDLPIGTIVESSMFVKHYKINADSWVKVSNLPHSRSLHNSSNDDMANLSINSSAPFTVVFTPEVQA